MKKLTKASIIMLSIILVISIFYIRLQPLRELDKLDKYAGPLNFHWKLPAIDSVKKTVLIIADNDGTEIFDLLAPFYLFNATEKANVYVVSEKKDAIILAKGLYILPQMTFAEADSFQISPDVIVIPNQSVKLGGMQKVTTVNWIRKKYNSRNLILSICHGSATAATTGIYDGKPLTTHSTNFENEKKQYPKPVWVKDVSYTQNGNLYSTAGVANATEGCLAVINTLFGPNTMKKVLNDVQYPEREIRKHHESLVLDGGAIINFISKIIFRRNLNVGVLLSNGINEFELASVLDTYGSTAPACIKSFATTHGSVTSKYGLTIYPTSSSTDTSFNEAHVLMPDCLTSNDLQALKKSNYTVYYHADGKYIINKCLDRIENQYGVRFQQVIKLILDYN